MRVRQILEILLHRAAVADTSSGHYTGTQDTYPRRVEMA